MKGSFRAYAREAWAVGMPLATGMIWRRARSAWEKVSDAGEARRRESLLSDTTWRDGLRGESAGEIARRFQSGAVTLGWAATASPESVRNHLNSAFPDHVAGMCASALRIRKGQANLFGSWVQVRSSSGTIEWQHDWLSGKSWAADTPSHMIPVGKEPPMDPRVAWELGRCHQCVTLAQAYWLTGDRSTAEEAVAQIQDFIVANPTGLGIQWASTMDVAIRAANLLLAWDLLRTAPAARVLSTTLLRSLIEHGRYIVAHLENRDGITSNHYLADLAGLAYLSRLSPVWPPFAKWYGVWQVAMRRELRRQFLDDGFDFEASTSYHRLAVELVMFPAILGTRSSTPCPPWLHSMLTRMITAVSSYATSSGHVPRFGDNDSSRLHVLHPRTDGDHSYLLSLGEVFLNTAPTPACPETVWIQGPRVSNAMMKSDLAHMSCLPNAGIVSIRDHGTQLVATCGENGQEGRGGHAHNDKLSFVLNIADEEVIVDPGTWQYTADLESRHAFRSTMFHSTLMLGGEEQNRYSLTSAFRLWPDATPSPWRIRTTPSGLHTASASHSGYERSPLRLRHSRRFAHRSPGPRWVVLDWVRRSRGSLHPLPPVPFVLTLPLAPRVEIGALSAVAWTIRTPLGRALHGQTSLSKAEGEWHVEEGWYAPAYGSRIHTNFLRLRGILSQGARTHSLRTVIHVAD